MLLEKKSSGELPAQAQADEYRLPRINIELHTNYIY